jgi:hypothetical protein
LVSEIAARLGCVDRGNFAWRNPASISMAASAKAASPDSFTLLDVLSIELDASESSLGGYFWVLDPGPDLLIKLIKAAARGGIEWAGNFWAVPTQVREGRTRLMSVHGTQ